MEHRVRLSDWELYMLVNLIDLALKARGSLGESGNLDEHEQEWRALIALRIRLQRMRSGNPGYTSRWRL